MFVFGIFFFVFREGAPFLFGGLNLGEFFTSSDWNPVSDTPHYGILGLLAGTVSVTVLAMAIAVPLGLGAAVYVSEFSHAQDQGVPEDRDRDAGRDSLDRVGLHRLHDAQPADHRG